MPSRPRPPLRLLIHEYVTGGGFAGQPLPVSWAREGAAMRRAVVEDFSALPDVEVTFTLDARFRPSAGAVSVQAGREAAAFADLARESDAVLVVAPEPGGVLARRERRLLTLGVRSLGCHPSAVADTADKLATARRLAASGIPVIPTRLHDPHRPPPDRDMILKPRRGAGSIDTHLVRAGESWPPMSGAAVVQPFANGEPMSAAAIVGRDGHVRWIGTASQSIKARGDRLVYRGGAVPGEFSTDLRDRLTRVLGEWPGLAGWVGIDYIWDPETRRARVLEINPRLTTSYIGHRARLGGRWIAAAWLHAVGLGPAPGPCSAENPQAVRFRADGRVFQIE